MSERFDGPYARDEHREGLGDDYARDDVPAGAGDALPDDPGVDAGDGETAIGKASE